MTWGSGIDAALGANRKRVQRLMALIALEALFPRPRPTIPALDAPVYPSLLRDWESTHVNEVWSSDIPALRPLPRRYANRRDVKATPGEIGLRRRPGLALWRADSRTRTKHPRRG